jgi:hypothetical protein
MKDVAVLYDVFISLQAKKPLVLHGLFRSEAEDVFAGETFGPDEAFCQVRMNGSRGVDRVFSFPYRPGPDLVLADNEKADMPSIS